MKKNITNILRKEEMLNLACLQFPREVKNAASIYPPLKALILIRNNSLTFEESKTEIRLNEL